MATKARQDLDFAIGHVLFVDIVGYSKLLLDDQRAVLGALNQLVRSTAAFRSADEEGKLTRLPTGDGMSMAFFSTAEAPARCAVELAMALRAHPEIPVPMGIHSGPVSDATDANDRSNVAGAGINLAQRVMDCGDVGHILLSK